MNLTSQRKLLKESIEKPFTFLLNTHGLPTDFLKVRISKNSITLSFKRKEDDELVTMILSGEQVDDYIYLYPPAIKGNLGGNSLFKQWAFVVLTNPFILYANRKNITKIKVGKSNPLDSTLKTSEYWDSHCIEKLLSLGFKVINEQEHKDVKESNKYYNLYYKRMTEDDKEQLKDTLKYKKDTFVLEVYQAVNCLNIIVVLDKIMRERWKDKPMESVEYSFLTDNHVLNIEVKDAIGKSSFARLIYRFGNFEWNIDGVIKPVEFPFHKDIEKIIGEIHEQNKFSYLVSPPPLNRLKNIFNGVFTEKQLLNLVQEANKYGLSWMDFENEAAKYESANLRGHGLFNHPSIEIKQITKATWFLLLKGVYMYISNEDGKFVKKISKNKKEFDEFIVSI